MAETLRFGYDGDGGLGDRLRSAVLRGEKTATSSLAVEYLSGEPLPRVGQRLTLLDHAGVPHGIVETTRVTVVPLHLVGDDVARAEGEGFAAAQEWRRAHEAFWADVIDLVRADAGDPAWQLRQAEAVVVHWFRLVTPTVEPPPEIDQQHDLDVISPGPGGTVRALVLDHVEAFNTHDRARLLSGLAKDVVWSTERDTIRGVKALAEIFDDRLWAMQPSLTVEHLLVQGDRAGAQMTEELTVAGEQRRFAIAVFFHVQRGRIQQAKVYREGTADID